MGICINNVIINNFFSATYGKSRRGDQTSRNKTNQILTEEEEYFLCIVKRIKVKANLLSVFLWQPGVKSCLRVVWIRTHDPPIPTSSHGNDLDYKHQTWINDFGSTNILVVKLGINIYRWIERNVAIVSEGKRLLIFIYI